MFDSLKKRLKHVVDKVSKTIAKEEPKAETKATTKEELPETPKLEAESEQTASFDEQLDKKIAELEELKEKAEEERLPPEVAEGKAEAKIALHEEKSRLSLLQKITEKRLSDSEIEKILKELHIALLENDVAVEVADRISDDVKKQLSGSAVRRGRAEDTIKDALKHAMLGVMSQEKVDLEELIKNKDGPFTIVFVGFNGTGKTSTASKIAYKFKEFRPVLAAADTFRAASIEQLEEHGRRLGVRVVKHTYGADSAAVIFDAKKHAAASGSKLVIADTAGRSHANVNLMDELKKVVRVNQPDMKILVLDSVTGNDIYDQCRLFNDAVGIDAIILTKADVYERGGAALSAAYTLKKPILYIGTGQGYEDLKEFSPEEIVKNLLG